jgi:hypothetical protein
MEIKKDNDKLTNKQKVKIGEGSFAKIKLCLTLLPPSNSRLSPGSLLAVKKIFPYKK